MKFKYSQPIEDKPKTVDRRFLPSIAFTVFLNLDEEESGDSLSLIACRRFPQMIKMKTDRTGNFDTRLIIPVGKSGNRMSFIDMVGGPFWDKHVFLPSRHGSDYVVGGELSYKDKILKAQIYSTIDGEVIFSQDYASTENSGLALIDDFASDLLLIMQSGAGQSYKPVRDNTAGYPVRNDKALTELILGLDYDPANRVYPEGHRIFLRHLKNSLTADPESEAVAKILVEVARDVFRVQELSESEKIVDFILSLRPGDPGANQLKTRIMVQQNRTAEAMDRLDQLSGEGIDVGEVAFRLGRDLLETHLTQPARKLFEKAMDLEYKDPSLYDCLGYLLIESGDREKALEVMMEGLDFFPGREYALVTTAQLLTETGKFREAKIAYETARSLYPNSATLHVSFGIHLLQTNHHDAGERMINRALELAPEDPYVNVEAARFFGYLKKNVQSIRYARTAIELAPGSLLAGEAQEFMSRTEAGISRQEQAANREQFIKARRMMDEKGGMSKALEILEEVTSLEPYFWKAQFIKGFIYRKKNRLENALETFTKIDELFPDQVSLHHEIGRCLMGLERFSEAFPHLIYAFRKRPQDPVIMANMGLVYLFTGKINEAEVLLLQAKRMSRGQALNLDPYIREVQKIKKRKELSRGNGSTVKKADTFEGTTGKENDKEEHNQNPESEDSAGKPNGEESRENEQDDDPGLDMPPYPGLN